MLAVLGLILACLLPRSVHLKGLAPGSAFWGTLPYTLHSPENHYYTTIKPLLNQYFRSFCHILHFPGRLAFFSPMARRLLSEAIERMKFFTEQVGGSRARDQSFFVGTGMYGIEHNRTHRTLNTME